MTHHNEQRELPLIQQAIIPIAAFAATGDQSKLTPTPWSRDLMPV